MTPELKKRIIARIQELHEKFQYGRKRIRKIIIEEFNINISEKFVRYYLKKSNNQSVNKKPTFQERAMLKDRQKEYDPYATKEDLIEDLRRVQNMFPAKYITENLYWLEGKYSFSTYCTIFGNYEEFRRQALLQPLRGQHAHQRNIAKHASLDTYRKFFTEEVTPYVGCYEKPENYAKRLKTIIVGSDFHDVKSDPFVLAVFIDTCQRIQPDVIVLNGDVFDLYEFSRFDIDPRLVDIVGRFNFVKEQIFAKLRKACPDSQIDFILGNHEWRLLKLLADKTPHLKVLLADVVGLTLEDIFGVHKYQINLVCKWDLAAFMIQDVRLEIKNNYKVYYGAYVVAHMRNDKYGLSGTSGHTHIPKQETFWNIHGKHSWVVSGCICKTPEEYRDGPDVFKNGFVITIVDVLTKQVQQQLIEIPGDFVAVAGKIYTRAEALAGGE